MEVQDFRRRLGTALIECGFVKKRATYYRRTTELLWMCELARVFNGPQLQFGLGIGVLAHLEQDWPLSNFGDVLFMYGGLGGGLPATAIEAGYEDREIFFARALDFGSVRMPDALREDAAEFMSAELCELSRSVITTDDLARFVKQPVVRPYFIHKRFTDMRGGGTGFGSSQSKV